jgi:tetratricopeptide (TPR) repeat protein
MGLSLLGRAEESETQFAAARKALDEHASLGAGNIESLFAIAQQQSNLAYQLYTAGDADGALALYERSEQQWAEVLKLSPQLPEAQLALSQLYLNRADIYLTYFHLREGIAELDKLIDNSAELSQVGDATWMSASFKMMIAAAKVQRWNSISNYRAQGFQQMIDEGHYAVLVDQLRGLTDITEEPSDHYLAAQLLCQAIVSVAAKADASSEETEASEPGAEDDSAATMIDRMASSAVEHLNEAWKAGYIRRQGGLTSLFSSRPSTETLRTSERFDPLRERDDFQRLLADMAESTSETESETVEDAEPDVDEPPQPTTSSAPDTNSDNEDAAAPRNQRQSPQAEMAEP